MIGSIRVVVAIQSAQVVWTIRLRQVKATPSARAEEVCLERLRDGSPEACLPKKLSGFEGWLILECQIAGMVGHLLEKLKRETGQPARLEKPSRSF